MILTEKSLRKAIKSIILEMRPEPIYSDDLLFPDDDRPVSSKQSALNALIAEIKEKIKDDPRIYIQDINEKVPMNAMVGNLDPQFPFEVYEDHELYKLVANSAYKYVTGQELLDNSEDARELYRILYGQEAKYKMEAPTIEELFDSAVKYLKDN